MASMLEEIVWNDSFTSLSPSISPNNTQHGVMEYTPITQLCLGVLFNITEKQRNNISEDSVSNTVEKYAQRFKLGILLVLFLIGLPANLMNMAVFYTQGLKDRVNLLLFSLSITDALFITSCFCLDGENIYLLLTGEAVNPHWNAFLVNNNLVCFFGTGLISIVLITIIACERCYCVLNPLKYQTWLRTRTMGLIIVVISLAVFGVHFPVAYKYRVGCVSDPATGGVRTTLIAGAFYKANKDIIDRIEGFVNGLFIVSGGMLVVITATIITTVKLHQLMTWRSETSSSSSSLSSRDVALTKMLIGNSVFFIVCCSPSSFFRVVWFFLPQLVAGGEGHDVFLTTVWISEAFLYANFTFNFFIYYMMGSRYRDTFWSLLGKSGRQKTGKK